MMVSLPCRLLALAVIGALGCTSCYPLRHEDRIRLNDGHWVLDGPIVRGGEVLIPAGPITLEAKDSGASWLLGDRVISGGMKACGPVSVGDPVPDTRNLTEVCEIPITKCPKPVLPTDYPYTLIGTLDYDSSQRSGRYCVVITLKVNEAAAPHKDALRIDVFPEGGRFDDGGGGGTAPGRPRPN